MKVEQGSEGRQSLSGVWGVPTFSLFSRRRREKALLRSPVNTLVDLDTDSLVFYTQNVGNLASERCPSPSFVQALNMYFHCERKRRSL
jgi:hypothetical protein